MHDAPQSIASARALAAREPRAMLLENSSAEPEFSRSLLFRQPLQWLEVHSLNEIPAAFAQIDRALAQGQWVAGYLSYECGFHFEPTAHPHYTHPAGTLPLACIGIYAAPTPCTPSTDPLPPDAGLTDFTLALTEQQYTGKFRRVQQLIAAGDTYQLNLTAEVQAAYNGDPAALFAHMMSAQPVPFGALLNLGESHILSASPELFFHQQYREITVRPMKGTAPRGATPEEDNRLAAALAADEKNRAENIMIVDLLRNDLGRIAEFGSVRPTKLFQVERLPSVLQMTSELRATLRPGITPYELFAALFPSGSIIGAPKVHSMQLIHAIEQRHRGVYTGAIGFWSPAGEAVFSVAIRTAVLRNGQLIMGVGSGIVADSTARAEYAECLLKAGFLLDPTFGLIETMRSEAGRIALLPLHLHRLAASAAHFHFRFNATAIEQAIQAHIAALDPATPHHIRLVLHRNGAVTFSPPQPIAPDPTPVRVALWPDRIDSSNHLLHHKTTRRALYNRAQSEARAQDLADFLFLNQHGHLTEGAIHNVFLRHGAEWRTPSLTDGLLNGVYRRHLLATQPHIVEYSLTLADLRSADEIWLTNAVRGIRKATIAG